MSAVARDSPQMMGEAADTPQCRCPVLQRDWLGEGQLSPLTRHKSGKGVELGTPPPPLALPLHYGLRHYGPRERRHTAWPLKHADRLTC